MHNPNINQHSLVDAKDTWSSWFVSLNRWENDFIVDERLASLVVRGVPPQAWCLEAFSKIVKKWGIVVSHEDCVEDSLNMASGRITVLTKEMGWINESCSIDVGGFLHKVHVFEDQLVSTKLIPGSSGNSCQGDDFEDSDYSADSFFEDDDRSSEFCIPVNHESENHDQKDNSSSERENEEASSDVAVVGDRPASVNQHVEVEETQSMTSPVTEKEAERGEFLLGGGSKSNQEEVMQTAHVIKEAGGSPKLNSETDLQQAQLPGPGQIISRLAFSQAGPRPDLGPQTRPNPGLVHGQAHINSSRPPFPLKAKTILTRSVRRGGTSGGCRRSVSRNSTEGSIDLNKDASLSTADDVSRLDRPPQAEEEVSRVSDSVTSGEVQDTMEIGKMLGFQMDGCESAVRKVIKSKGDVLVDQ